MICLWNFCRKEFLFGKFEVNRWKGLSFDSTNKSSYVMSKASLGKYKKPSTDSKLYKKSKKIIPTRNNFIVVFASKFRGINPHVTWGWWEVMFVLLFFNWDSLHTSLNSHYKAWSYKKKKHKKIKSYRKSL